MHRKLLFAAAAAVAATGCTRAKPARQRQLAEGVFQGCRLDTAGHVTCWRVGPEHVEGTPVGVIRGLADATQITAALGETCALRRGGTVACWGIDWTTSPTSAPEVDHPVAIPGLDHVVQVSAGRSHVCAVRSTGDVWCWGDDARGQVSGGPRDGHALTVSRPTRVAGIADAVEVACGDSHTCVRHRDGTVSCFGAMSFADDAPRAVRSIPGLHDVIALASGQHFVCGLTRAGEVWCAGDNMLGQLGSGDHDPHDGAVRVRGLSSVEGITAMGVHACARTHDGEVWCWGSEFGHGIMPSRTDDMDHGPVRIEGLGKVVDVSVGEREACASLADSSVWCWGAQHGGRTQGPPARRF